MTYGPEERLKYYICPFITLFQISKNQSNSHTGTQICQTCHWVIESLPRGLFLLLYLAHITHYFHQTGDNIKKYVLHETAQLLKKWSPDGTLTNGCSTLNENMTYFSQYDPGGKSWILTSFWMSQTNTALVAIKGCGNSENCFGREFYWDHDNC